MQIFVDGYCKNAKNFFDYPYLIFRVCLIKIKQFFLMRLYRFLPKAVTAFYRKKAFLKPN